MNSLYFEDFEAGQIFESAARTVTETDLTMFSMLSGDWNPIHADAEYARATRFGERVVHGALGIAMATGMMHQLGIFEESVVAMTDLQEWKFVAPILVGQTLRLRLEILGKEEGSSKRTGKLLRRLTILNQAGDVIQDGKSGALVLKQNRPGAAA
jgi:acyl dehydratase